jgi:hypothetical protein
MHVFRFTIRDLLWLTFLVAIAAAWWVERRDMLSASARLRSEKDAAERENLRLAKEKEEVAKDFHLIVDSLGKLRIDPAHIVSAAKARPDDPHTFEILIERRGLPSVHGQSMDFAR